MNKILNFFSKLIVQGFFHLLVYFIPTNLYINESRFASYSYLLSSQQLALDKIDVGWSESKWNKLCWNVHFALIITLQFHTEIGTVRRSLLIWDKYEKWCLSDFLLFH